MAATVDVLETTKLVNSENYTEGNWINTSGVKRYPCKINFAVGDTYTTGGVAVPLKKGISKATYVFFNPGAVAYFCEWVEATGKVKMYRASNGNEVANADARIGGKSMLAYVIGK